MNIRISTSIFSLILVLGLQAQQVDDNVSMGPGYAEQVYYSMENGEVGTASLSAWDLAFTSDPFDAAILVNDHQGIQVLEYLGPIADWQTLDTTGMMSAPLYNADTVWTAGAMNLSTTLSGSPFDYGWGQYNPVTHIVSGDRIFVLNFMDGTSMKILVEALNLGTYTLKYAMLDGSAEQTLSVNGADYNTKNFWYLDMQTNQVLDLEPVSDTWDITFTRFTSEIFPGANYLVTGVFQNKGIDASEARGVLVADADWTSQPLETQRNIIGYDWKSFNMGTFSWELADSLSFFVKDQGEAIWKIVFTGFGGSANGNIEFTKELVGSVGLNEIEVLNVQVFPNPNEGTFQWVLPEGMEGAQLSILDMSGRSVYADKVIATGTQFMDLSTMTSGMYFLRVAKDEKIATERIIIQ